MSEFQRPTMKKSPTLAGFLSAFIPGAGQAYVGYYVSGFINIAVIGGVISLLNANSARELEPFFGLFMAFFWVFNVIDAVRKAKLYNLHQMGETEMPAPTDSPLFGGVVLVVIGLILTLTITFDLDMYWLEDVWPLFVLGMGIYLLWKYRRARRELENRPAPSDYSARVSPPPVPPSAPRSAPVETALPETSSSDEARASSGTP